jgi:hypothetical protein
MRRRPTAVRAWGPALLVVVALILGACGGGSRLEATCTDVITEELDPGWTVHLLPNAPEPEYVTDPPTSGPHYSATPVAGIVDAPLDDPSQVAVLEVGGVLVQYRPEALSGADRGRLERLAQDGVVVAPAPDLTDPVVATAWTTKQRCDGVALDSLTTFIADHGAQGPATSG